MSHRSSRDRRTRPPGLWHSVAPWMRAPFISFGLLIVIFAVNGVAVTALMLTNAVQTMIFYPVQLLAYVANGALAGREADSTRRLALRGVGHRGERVRRNLPNYVPTGALAGLVLALLGALVYLASNAILATIVPLTAVLGVDTPWLLIIVDIVAATGLGALGGIIYDRFLSAPGRR